MSNWQKLRIGDFANTYAGGTPARGNQLFFGGNIPWVKSTEVNQGKIFNTEETITETGLSSSSAKWIPANTVLVALYGATAAQIGFLKFKATSNQAVLAIIPTSQIDSYYLYYSLLSAKEKLLFLAQGSGQPNLNKQIVDNLKLDIPPLPHQRKIAKILTTVDNLIEKTESLIAKYQSIKQGMMHDLFTRGVDAKGKLRPPQSDAPELYKQSELGWIPKEWEVDELKNRLISIDAGWSPECIERPPTTGEWGILKVSAVTKGLYLAEESKTLPTQLKPKPLIEVKPNDVLVARSNGVSELVGVTVFVDKTQERLMLSDKIMRLKVDERFLTSKYLAEIMKTSEIRKQIEQVISGSSGQKNISQEEIKSLTIKFPPVAEQRNISLILNSLKIQIQQEFNVNRIMKNLKTALMQDLLTGKVQVTPDAEDKE